MQDPYVKIEHGNVVAYADNREKPWKANGSEVNPNASLDEWMDKAGINYEVKGVPTLYEWDGEIKKAPNKFQLIRSDTGASLSEVSGTYKVRQPREIMEFFKNLIDSNNMQMEVVGAMQGGKKIFALARTGATAEIGKGSGDIIGANVFLMESWDGSHATKARSGVERFFCLNQIESHGFSQSGFVNKNAVKRKHSQNFVPEEVQFELAHINDNFAKFVDFAQDMEKTRMTADMIERYYARIYAPEAWEPEALENWKRAKYNLTDNENISTNQLNVIKDLLVITEDNLGHALVSAEGTLWGALNSVTYYHDHEARTKGEKRWESAMVGSGNRKKNEAFALAKELIHS